MKIKYPVYQPDLSGKERDYVNECLESTWISSKGKFIREFEEKFAEYSGIKYATGVCNGTVALHLALVTLGIGEGDEVIVPTFTYIASVNAIAYTGATPVFADSLADTWQLDPADLQRKITPKTRAVMPVHIYGHMCDMERISQTAKRNGLFVIEDCAEAFGSRYLGQMAGNFGDIATFSFFGNKTITTGEGGMVATNDKTLYDRAAHFKGQGLAAHREYWHDVIGYNYRMTNICAALGLAQIERADEIIKKKRKIAAWYKNNLEGTPVHFQPEHENYINSYWMVTILTDTTAHRDELREALAEKGIETRPTFYPVHTMPMYSAKFHKFPIAEDIGWRGINLPSYPGLEEKDVEYICNVIKEFYGKS